MRPSTRFFLSERRSWARRRACLFSGGERNDEQRGGRHPLSVDPRWRDECRSYSDRILTVGDEAGCKGGPVAAKQRRLGDFFACISLRIRQVSARRKCTGCLWGGGLLREAF